MVSLAGRGVGTISALMEVHVRMAPACVLRGMEEITVFTALVSVYHTRVKSFFIN